MMNTPDTRVFAFIALVFSGLLPSVLSNGLAQGADAILIKSPGFIGAASGTGSMQAIAQARGDLRTHTLYRPVILPDDRLPVLVWSNGGCQDNGLRYSHFLREIASHGYLVVALGYALEEGLLESEQSQAPAPVIPQGPAPQPRPDPTHVGQVFQALDWLTARQADPADEFHGHVDLDHIAVAGHSCGGFHALKSSADPRIDTTLMFNSGIYDRGERGRGGINMTKQELDNLHGPILYLSGGPGDIAHEHASDDASRIHHVPVFFGWLPVGHGGTFWNAADGGQWGEVAVHWLDWQLKSIEAAAHWFRGEDCYLCRANGWTVEKRTTQ